MTVRTRAIDLRMSWLFEFALVGHNFFDNLVQQQHSCKTAETREKCSHSVQLGAGRSNLLDAELTELGLELSELLCQIILVLAPERASLNLSGRLFNLSATCPFRAVVLRQVCYRNHDRVSRVELWDDDRGLCMICASGSMECSKILCWPQETSTIRSRHLS